MKVTKKIYLISAINNQYRSYLAELLLEKNYEVHRIKRRPTNLNNLIINALFWISKNSLKSNIKLTIDYFIKKQNYEDLKYFINV